ncbi:retrovirus-related pol polyprotein from transposon TNT 1-94 [Tanacetum coccineum]
MRDLEDTLEIAEVTRKRMLEKVKSPQCVEHKVKIAPPDYSKENYLATFTPQRQLTPGQIFWSSDLAKITKTTPKPISKMTVYPPNTPERLVPRVLPTKSHVKINLYTLIQLFLDFDKTCKKRITLCGLTEGERGFEQTKKCYLTEVIPFFKMLKEHFEGIQKALIKEVKDMKAIFDQMKAEVDQNAVDNVINSEDTISRVSAMHDAYTIEQARVIELEAELSKLKHKIETDDLIVNFGVLNSRNKELTEHVNALQNHNASFRAEKEKVKQHYKELYDSIKITHSVTPKVLARGKYAIDVEPLPPRLRYNKDAHLDYLRHLKKSVEIVHEILEGVSSSTKASGSKPRRNTKKDRILPAKIKNKKKVEDYPRINKSIWTKVNRVDSSISSKRVVINSNSGSMCKTCNKCLISSNHDMCVVKYLNSMNANPLVKNVVNKKKLIWKATGCSKHMTGNRLRLKNFIKKFIGTVRFGNDHFCAIMGYKDYVIGDSVISRVYYVEGLRHNLFSVGKFCDSNIEVAFRKHSCFVRDIEGVDLLKGSRAINFYTISIDEMMKSSPICLLSKASKSKSWLWHRRLNHLNFGTINEVARKDLSINGKKYILVIVDDYSRFTWVKFLRSKDETPEFVIKFLKQIQVGLNKTIRYIKTDNGTEFVNLVMTEFYESVGIFHQKFVPRTPQQNDVVERRNRTLVEAARTMLIFSKSPIKDLGKFQAKADIRIFLLNKKMAPVRISSGPEQNLLTLRQISSGIVPNSVPATTFVAPTDKDLEILFQPMFDEYLEPSRANRQAPPATADPVPVILAGGPIIKENPYARADNDPLINILAPKPSSAASSPGDVSTAEQHHIT